MARYAARIEYDGSHYSGWQAQKHTPNTVQAELERALSLVADGEIKIVTAGRTDSKVHATHQVVHFDTEAVRPELAWVRGANRFMAQDVRMHWIVEVDEDFHARFSALSRSYRYIIHNSQIRSALFHTRSTTEYCPLDVSRMQRAALDLVGEHDFSSFRAAGCQAKSPVRTMTKAELNQNGPWIWLDIQANAFLQHMVRNIIGSLISIGLGKNDVSWVRDLLELKDRKAAGVTAGPNGLYLTGVEYDDRWNLPSQRELPVFWGTC